VAKPGAGVITLITSITSTGPTIADYLPLASRRDSHDDLSGLLALIEVIE